MRAREIVQKLIRGSVGFLPGPIKHLLKKMYQLAGLLKARIRLSVGHDPISNSWMDRGKPIHREYLERFLRECSLDIRGNCLEFQEDSYTSAIGSTQVKKIEILHHTPENPKATIVADLTLSNNIPSNSFDCIICTYVLHVIADKEKMISSLFRILKTGGVLLVGVPCIQLYYSHYGELWRFTPEGLKSILSKSFEPEEITIKAYGNSLIAAGELRGLRSREFTQSELNHHDGRFPLIVCARAFKK